MTLIDNILEKKGLKFNELSKDEMTTLDSMLASLQRNTLTIESLREYIESLRDSVELELINEPEFIYLLFFKFPNRKQIYLKARLRNLLLLKSFLDRPGKAKKQVERALAGM